ncbi:hypothetical protein CPB86DRAFT_200432 [Serendipita vermifera]|nr:hypothetical protein CPB86DRAFT_200432 [Serendipita vermifera]
MDIVGRAVTTNVGTSSSQVLAVYYSFHLLAGHIFLPILAFTFIFLTKRPPTLVNLCLSGTFSGICACLLLYSGKQSGPEPSFTLCHIQASVMYGTLPLTSTSWLAAVYGIWETVYPATPRDNVLTRIWQRSKPVVLLGGPWISWLSWSTAAAWLIPQHPDKLSRNRRFFYCSLEYNPYSDGISAFCGIILFIATILEVSIIIDMTRGWRAVRKGVATGAVDISTLIRVLFFSLYTILGLVFGFLSIKAPKSPLPDLWLASVGLMTAVVFGATKSVFAALFSWGAQRKVEPEKKPDSYSLV